MNTSERDAARPEADGVEAEVSECASDITSVRVLSEGNLFEGNRADEKNRSFSGNVRDRCRRMSEHSLLFRDRAHSARRCAGLRLQNYTCFFACCRQY